MTGIGFPDPDELIREADKRDREAERDAEPKQERGRGEGSDPTDEEATDEEEGRPSWPAQ
ncbi:MAG: hypothetical protein ABIQ05_04580 [Candidatus Limnocylindria bacterium]